MRYKQEKRFVFVRLDELQGLFLNHIRCILAGFLFLITGQHYFLVVVPQKARVIVMSKPLAIVTVKLVESLINWVSI